MDYYDSDAFERDRERDKNKGFRPEFKSNFDMPIFECNFTSKEEKPNRETKISEDDILNLIIALNDPNSTFDDFLKNI